MARAPCHTGTIPCHNAPSRAIPCHPVPSRLCLAARRSTSARSRSLTSSTGWEASCCSFCAPIAACHRATRRF
eukprot:5805733-Prymnesium_polylepis.2